MSIKWYFMETFLSVQWLRLCFPMQGVWVQSLVRELRSTCLVTKKKKTEQKQYCEKFSKDFKKKRSPSKKLLKKTAFHGCFSLHFLISGLAEHLRVIDLLSLLSVNYLIISVVHISVFVFFFFPFTALRKSVYFGSSFRLSLSFIYVVFIQEKVKQIADSLLYDPCCFLLKKWHKIIFDFWIRH